MTNPTPPIPRPPTPAEQDQVSDEQGLISDEWGDAPPGDAAVRPAKEPPGQG